LKKVVRGAAVPGGGCASKTWSFSSACKNLGAQLFCFVLHCFDTARECDRQTDGRTDGRTDAQTMERWQRREKHSAFARKNEGIMRL